MNVNTVATVLLIAAAVVWILWRQVQAQPVKAKMLLVVPVLLGYFGIRDTASGTWTDPAALALIAVGALASAGVGLARGTTIRVWRERDGVWWSKGSKATLLLWGVMILVRGTLDGVAHATGHSAAGGLGPMLLSFGLSFAGQNAVIAMRMGGQPFAAQPQPAPVQMPRQPQDRPDWQPYAPASGPVDLGRLGQNADSTDNANYSEGADFARPFDYAYSAADSQHDSSAQSGYGAHTLRPMHRDLRAQRIAARRADRAARRGW